MKRWVAGEANYWIIAKSGVVCPHDLTQTITTHNGTLKAAFLKYTHPPKWSGDFC